MERYYLNQDKEKQRKSDIFRIKEEALQTCQALLSGKEGTEFPVLSGQQREEIPVPPSQQGAMPCIQQTVLLY